MKQLIIVISIIVLSNCTNSKNDFKHTGEKNLFYINAFLDRLPVFAPVTLTANDSLLFGFIKGAIESDTSWNLMIIKSDTTITARYTQILPSFVSGFDGYIDDS